MYFFVFWKNLLNDSGLFQEKSKQGGLEDIGERACGNSSRGQLKQKWDFQGIQEKVMWTVTDNL